MYRESEAGTACRLPRPGCPRGGDHPVPIAQKGKRRHGRWKQPAWVSQLEGMRWGFKSGACGQSPWLSTALCFQECQRPKCCFLRRDCGRNINCLFWRVTWRVNPSSDYVRAPAPCRLDLPSLGLVGVVVQDLSEAQALGWCVGWGFEAALGPG